MNYFRKINTFQTILLGLSFLLLTSFIFSAFLYFFNTQIITEKESRDILSVKSGLVYQILMNVLFSPFIETLFFQKWIIQFVRFFYKDGKYFKIASILLSSICFGLMHFYSLLYILKTFFLGIVFAFFYIEFSDKKISSFWIVFIMHALFNLLVTMNVYFNNV